jgi:mannose-6-phosphate isomerase-like protein (cupin superfamily)
MDHAAASTEAVPPFVMPPVKEDPNPLIIQGPAGEIFRFVRTGASTCGRYLMARATIPPGAGPIPHVHHWTDEFFVFPEGGFTLFLGTQLYPTVLQEPGRNAPKDHIALIQTKPGDVFYGPRFMIHGLINNTQVSHDMYYIWMPDVPAASILNYFKTVGTVLSSPDNPPPIDPVSKIRFVTEATLFGINQSSDFFQYVADTDTDGRPMDAFRNKQLMDMLTSVGDGSNCTK